MDFESVSATIFILFFPPFLHLRKDGEENQKGGSVVCMMIVKHILASKL